MTKRQMLIAKKVSSYVLASFVLVLFGQNCSMGFAPIVYLDHFSSTSSSSSGEFLAAKTILKNNCTSCHSPSGVQADSRLDMTAESQFELAGLVVAGQPDQSKLIQKLKNFTGTSSLTKTMPLNGSISDSDYQTLRRWIMAMGATSSDSNPYTCNTGNSLEDKLVVQKLQVLTNVQYTNTIKDFLALAIPASATQVYNSTLTSVAMPSDSGAKFARTIADLSKEKLSAYFNIADKLGANLTDSNNGPTFLNNIISLNPGVCTGASISSLSLACQKQFIRNLGLRLYRRPLNEVVGNDEVETFRQEFVMTSDISAAISNLVFRFMMSQNFLFKMENNEVESPSNPKLLQLSSFSIANRLSYTFWNTMPDEQLLSMAAAGNLQDDLKFIDAMNYVMSSPKMISSMKEFAYGWLVLNKTPNFDPNTASLQFFSNGLTFDGRMHDAMNDEAQELVSYVARNNGKFSDIFTTDISFARYSPLMQIYGVTTPAPATITPQNAVRMPAGTRSGILTRAALLSETTGGQNLIHRSVRIKRDLLCISQPPPPANVVPPVPITDEEFPTMTFRQRFDHDTGTGVCFSCHQTINPYGHALSKYNGLGFYGQTEPAFTKNGMLAGNQLPTDASASLSSILSGGQSFSDPISYSNFISQRPEAQNCFVRNYAIQFLGREPDTAAEGCRLNKMFSIIKSGTLKDAMSSIATDIEFRHKKLD